MTDKCTKVISWGFGIQIGRYMLGFGRRGTQCGKSVAKHYVDINVNNCEKHANYMESELNRLSGKTEDTLYYRWTN